MLLHLTLFWPDGFYWRAFRRPDGQILAFTLVEVVKVMRCDKGLAILGLLAAAQTVPALSTLLASCELKVQISLQIAKAVDELEADFLRGI